MSESIVDSRGIPEDRRADLRDYAEYLIGSHAQDIESLSVSEMADEFFEAEEDAELLTEEEMRYVMDLLNRAVVTVTWPAGVTK